MQQGRFSSLGLSPLCGVADAELSSNRLVRLGSCLVDRSRLFNKLIYPLQGIAAHEGAFCRSTRQTCCALKTGLTLSQPIKMPQACNVARPVRALWFGTRRTMDLSDIQTDHHVQQASRRRMTGRMDHPRCRQVEVAGT